MTERKPFKTSIGGQALIEGVMMRGPEKSAMAVRVPDSSVTTEIWVNPASMKKWYRKAPFIRGAFNMVDSMITGYKCLMRSANLVGMEDEEPSKFEKWLANKLGKSLSAVVAAVALVLGAGLAIGLFMILPTFLVSLPGRFSAITFSPALRALLEGVLKIAIFVIYLALVSRMREIRRVFEYHGAEHKTIACYEAGLPLTVENVRPRTRFHPRCGTSFILIALVISILTTSVINTPAVILRVALKLLLLPVVVGISYELIKYAGRRDNPLTRVLSAPGLWFQRLTTKEPDDGQIEVAIASMLPVIPEGVEDNW
jgi:uncharacterized protein YqhQ